MPLVGMGTAAFPFAPENTKAAIIDAIEIGYRHFDTASLYGSEEPLGEAIIEAQKLGFIKSRDELFITSKLWCDEAHPHLVLSAIKKSLRNLKMEYLDLYLIHMPFSSKPGSIPYPVNKDDLVPMDMKLVWEAMEECQRLALAKAIGVSNFTEKKLELLLTTAKIPPQVNQVEMNPTWQQIKLREYCNKKGIHVTAYSPLGGQDAAISRNRIQQSDVLKEIADARGKTVAQVSLRWVHEQGVSLVVKSFNKERLKMNLEIFDWELTKEDCHKISQVPQCKKVTIDSVVSNKGDWKPQPDDEL